MHLTEAEQQLIDILKVQPFDSNQELADRLDKSLSTIQNQMRGLYKKFGIEGGVDSRKRGLLFLEIQKMGENPL